LGSSGEHALWERGAAFILLFSTPVSSMFVDKIDLNQKKQNLRILLVPINFCKQSDWILVFNNTAQSDLFAAIDARDETWFRQ
jgi:hypothetical protein